VHLADQVLLTHEPASGRPRPGTTVTEKDVDNRRPLDVALLTQQWPAVRLLIASGALSKCPELDDARRELEQLLPPEDACAKQGGLMAALVSYPVLRHWRTLPWGRHNSRIAVLTADALAVGSV
jgi:hypothetical protein